jgi:primosomal protein N' (replication factor Y) (superfamily II helicase)
MSEFWSVAVDAPIAEPLTYSASVEHSQVLKRGHLVKVPLGKRSVNGVILSASEKSKNEKFVIKQIQDISSEYRPLPEFFLKWLEWLANYYVHPLGSVVSAAYPPLKKADKPRKSQRAPVVPTLAAKAAPKLTQEQEQVFASIQQNQGFSTNLLFGVTGSGKTEVYLRLLEETLKRNQRGLVLVPEISLTPQLVHRFAERFGDQIAVLHSQLTDRERTNQWWDIVEGKKKILIGARSALFCPIEDLGLIIVDEEHEPSFKQDEKLKYHGRDAAVMLGKFANCAVVLGSATPSLETWKNAIDGRYVLHEMKSRVENRSLPDVQVVDLRTQEKNSDLPFWLSPLLFQSMASTLERGDQSAVFLNRRGVAQVVLCPLCGYTHECPNCDITLTLHGKSHLVCHYCDYHEDMKLSCPSCKEGEIKPVGLGTELIETDLQRLFPEARIARADRDEIQNREALEDLIQKMEKGEIDILVGTQMIAKGLDFPKLNLVGLALADVGFNLPDFRATERSFQLITQVSGRAGRHQKSGESAGQVVVQTYNPDHPSLVFAKEQDYRAFATFELAQREPLGYPPHGKLVSFRIQGTQLSKVQETARLLADRCHQLKQQIQIYDKIEVLGPAEAAIAKLRGQFRYHLLLKGPDHRGLNAFCHQVLGDQKWLTSGTRLSLDVDPLHLL